jgi:hypothetical protein
MLNHVPTSDPEGLLPEGGDASNVALAPFFKAE